MTEEEKVDFDGSFEVGDIVTKDPQWGIYWKVKSVDGLKHTLVQMKGSGGNSVCVGDPFICIRRESLDYREFVKRGTMVQIITKIHEDGK
ncbi:MAG: hypothetical protein WD512_13305 [Candidatus Paceibacterota bacterium]